MNDKDYRPQLKAFLEEIRDLDVDEFYNIDSWRLSEELLNGVLVGYELPTKTSRQLLHVIGQKYGLVPMCPNDVIDLKMSEEFKPIGFEVISIYGRFLVTKKNG